MPDEIVNQAASLTDLTPPDIESLRGPTAGVEYVTLFDSGQPGPHLLINALGHGNELCGAVALARLMRLGVRPRRGRLSLVLADVAAFRRFDPSRPQLSRYVDEDFNRVWSDAVLDGPGDSLELRRARELRPFYRQADALLDLHSMTNPGEALVLCGRTGRALALALALGVPRWVVADSGHASGRRLIEYGPFAGPDGAAAPAALLVECGQHREQQAAEVAFAMCLLFLDHYGVIDPADAASLMPHLDRVPQQVIEVTAPVTAQTDSFTFVADYPGMAVVPRAGTIIGYDLGQPVRTPHDDCVLIMPARRVRRGQTVVRFGRLVES